MDAISASTVRVTTMADGTLRLVVDIEPRDAKEAFGLFGAPGTAVALAALVPEHKRKEEAPKGGPLARLAGMWCADPKFQAWLGVESEERAAEFIRAECYVTSRADLDHDTSAAFIFKNQIRAPYMEYLENMNETHAGSNGL